LHLIPSTRLPLAVLVLFAGCCLCAIGCLDPSKGETMLSQDEAVEIAKKEFAKHRQPVSDYDISVEPYHADKNQWIVWFEKKGPFPIPGGKNAVLVHRNTGAAVFMPGE
jgi:hypothetical protein